MDKPKGSGMTSKVYLVLVPDNLAKPGMPNVRILCGKLTRELAQRICDGIPGSYIYRVIADKLPGTS